MQLFEKTKNNKNSPSNAKVIQRDFETQFQSMKKEDNKFVEQERTLDNLDKNYNIQDRVIQFFYWLY